MFWPFCITRWFKKEGLAIGTLSITEQIGKCREDRNLVFLLLFGKFGVYNIVARSGIPLL